MKPQHKMDRLLVVGLLAGVFMTGCSTPHNGQVIINNPNLVVPHVEEVRYTKRSTGPANELVFMVNAGKEWSGERDYKKEYFGKCDRCSYMLSLPNGANTFAASDVDIKVSSRPFEPSFHPKRGRVTITESDSGGISVDLHIDDERVPMLINGIYTLTADGVCYSSKRRQ